MNAALTVQEMRQRGFICDSDEAQETVQHNLSLAITAAVDLVLTRDDSLTVGNIHMDRQKVTFSVDGELVKVSLLEFKILWVLMTTPGRVFSREAIMLGAWGGVRVSPRTIDAHMVNLRNATKNANYQIVTIYAGGYSLKPVSTLIATPEECQA
jgi:DNA-binding response OmpR family regulator